MRARRALLSTAPTENGAPKFRGAAKSLLHGHGYCVMISGPMNVLGKKVEIHGI